MAVGQEPLFTQTVICLDSEKVLKKGCNALTRGQRYRIKYRTYFDSLGFSPLLASLILAFPFWSWDWVCFRYSDIDFPS